MEGSQSHGFLIKRWRKFVKISVLKKLISKHKVFVLKGKCGKVTTFGNKSYLQSKKEFTILVVTNFC